MVGREGMPIPAAKPKGPKLKFTRDDDSLLVELKETKDLTWKQIADFFPGRSSGTLQVRYCTKLKAKTTAWSDEMVSLERSYSYMFCLFVPTVEHAKQHRSRYILGVSSLDIQLMVQCFLV